MTLALVAGGQNSSGYLATAELYNPTTGTSASASSMTAARNGHTATLLNSGMVLLAGGENGSPTNPSYLATAELYNPATGTFTATGSMATARNGATATLLNNGMVFIAGGDNSLNGMLNGAELYNPATGTFTFAGPMTTWRLFHTATLLNNGTTSRSGSRLATMNGTP